MSWDEAVEHEITLPATGLAAPTDTLRQVAGGEESEPLTDARGSVVGRIVRRRQPLRVRIRTHPVVDGGYVRLSVCVRNEHPEPADDWRRRPAGNGRTPCGGPSAAEA
ncbi:hypothetical protein [Streptomyces halstedii]|uniref:hypothetical protein n=1 Tax=Streptomyces halstedii TaxID=1944 RepID=UPI003460122B|nr:hypothetical protein OG291_02285 [Streptomyces halstedii]